MNMFHSNTTLLLTYLIDALFAVLAIILARNILVTKSRDLRHGILPRRCLGEGRDPVSEGRSDVPRLDRGIQFILPFCISAFALATLLYFYISSSTEIANVWLNSHQHTPLLYKISGLWGNHEGSMLLFFTFLTAWATRLRHTDSIRLASFILLLIGGYMYLAANPFSVLAVKIASGQDLNPALQNPYLMIHPPILYAGQTLCFLLWIKACLTPDHPYTRLCFFLLTLGLVLGSRWAYGELGWGGFWFWDPVETVSLFPWLALAAAVHVSKKNPQHLRTCLLTAFPMVMLSLTLVRSGVLVSVHSFAFDALNGIWLGICTLIVVIISVVILNLHRRRENLSSLPVEGRGPVNTFRTLTAFGFLYAIIILCALILMPVLARIFFKMHITIDEHFFHQYINPALLIGLAFAGLALRMKAHVWSFITAMLCASLWCFTMQPHLHFLAIASTFIAFWIITSSLNYAKNIFSKGFVAAHLGVGLCILGASHAEIFTTKLEVDLNHLPPAFASYPIKHDVPRLDRGIQQSPNVTKEIFTISVGEKLLQPEIQHFHISHTTKHQTAITRVGLDDIHATVFKEEGRAKIELTHKPLINLFWVGIFVVLLGIGVSIRRFFSAY